jgi:hypothetical protein
VSYSAFSSSACRLFSYYPVIHSCLLPPSHWSFFVSSFLTCIIVFWRSEKFKKSKFGKLDIDTRIILESIVKIQGAVV